MGRFKLELDEEKRIERARKYIEHALSPSADSDFNLEHVLQRENLKAESFAIYITAANLSREINEFDYRDASVQEALKIALELRTISGDLTQAESYNAHEKRRVFDVLCSAIDVQEHTQHGINVANKVIDKILYLLPLPKFVDILIDKLAHRGEGDLRTHYVMTKEIFQALYANEYKGVMAEQIILRAGSESVDKKTFEHVAQLVKKTIEQEDACISFMPTGKNLEATLAEFAGDQEIIVDKDQKEAAQGKLAEITEGLNQFEQLNEDVLLRSNPEVLNHLLSIYRKKAEVKKRAKFAQTAELILSALDEFVKFAYERHKRGELRHQYEREARKFRINLSTADIPVNAVRSDFQAAVCQQYCISLRYQFVQNRIMIGHAKERISSIEKSLVTLEEHHGHVVENIHFRQAQYQKLCEKIDSFNGMIPQVMMSAAKLGADALACTPYFFAARAAERVISLGINSIRSSREYDLRNRLDDAQTAIQYNADLLDRLRYKKEDHNNQLEFYLKGIYLNPDRKTDEALDALSKELARLDKLIIVKELRLDQLKLFSAQCETRVIVLNQAKKGDPRDFTLGSPSLGYSEQSVRDHLPRVRVDIEDAKKELKALEGQREDVVDANELEVSLANIGRQWETIKSRFIDPRLDIDLKKIKDAGERKRLEQEIKPLREYLETQHRINTYQQLYRRFVREKFSPTENLVKQVAELVDAIMPAKYLRGRSIKRTMSLLAELVYNIDELRNFSLPILLPILSSTVNDMGGVLEAIKQPREFFQVVPWNSFVNTVLSPGFGAITLGLKLFNHLCGKDTDSLNTVTKLFIEIAESLSKQIMAVHRSLSAGIHDAVELLECLHYKVDSITLRLSEQYRLIVTSVDYLKHELKELGEQISTVAIKDFEVALLKAVSKLQVTLSDSESVTNRPKRILARLHNGAKPHLQGGILFDSQWKNHALLPVTQKPWRYFGVLASVQHKNLRDVSTDKVQAFEILLQFFQALKIGNIPDQEETKLLREAIKDYQQVTNQFYETVSNIGFLSPLGQRYNSAIFSLLKKMFSDYRARVSEPSDLFYKDINVMRQLNPADVKIVGAHKFDISDIKNFPLNKIVVYLHGPLNVMYENVLFGLFNTVSILPFIYAKYHSYQLQSAMEKKLKDLDSSTFNLPSFHTSVQSISIQFNFKVKRWELDFRSDEELIVRNSDLDKDNEFFLEALKRPSMREAIGFRLTRVFRPPTARGRLMGMPNEVGICHAYCF